MPRTLLVTSARATVAATPANQVALAVLAMPAPELGAFVRGEALANPFLEIEEDIVEKNAGEEDGKEISPGVEGGDGLLEEPLLPQWWELAGPPEEPALPRGVTEEIQDAGHETMATVNLGQTLRAQFACTARDPETIRVGAYLIGSLDDRGYLAADPVQIAADCGVSPAVVLRALAVLHRLDPPGIGARDLRECLLLQLRSRGRRSSLAYRLVRECFAELAARRYAAMERRFGVDAAALAEALREVRRLRPHPGVLVGSEPVRYIVPDVKIERAGAQYRVSIEDQAVPRVRLDAAARLWRRSGQPGPWLPEAKERCRMARWVVRAVARRRATLQRVTECIAEEQGEFLERGMSHMRPLSLRTIAARLGVHESTVARVAAGKYVDTPRGVFPLRFFFARAVPVCGGGESSMAAVAERIRRAIAQEDRESPLTDEALARLLEADGVRLARRTVAKYRDRMKIESAPLRRRRTRQTD